MALNNGKYNLLVDCSFIIVDTVYIESLNIYAGRLLQGLRHSKVFNLYALVNMGVEDYIDSLAHFKVDKIVISAKSKVFSKKIDRILGIVPFENQLKSHHIDIVLCPYSIGYIYVYPPKYHQHLIIHDLIPIHNRSASFFYFLMYKRVIKQVPHLISISEKTRKDVNSFFHKDTDVVYNSVFYDLGSMEEPVKGFEGKKYILDVNRFVVYKNAETLVRAFHLLKDQIPHLLYLKGKKHDLSFFNHLQGVIKDLGLPDRVILDTQNRSEGEMRYLYKNASLFVTPSLIEGFGYTPIEAIISKVPTLISDLDTLKEVTKGKIKTFNPHSYEELARQIKEMIENPPSEEEREALADFFVKEYSPERQVQQITKVILKNIGHTT